MPNEREFLEDRLNKMRETIGTIPELFKKQQELGEREIQSLIARAGIADQIEALRNRTEEYRKGLQKEADVLAGRIAEVQGILEKFYYAPIPEGITHIHGIELEPLDWQTRLMVMQGNKDTIAALGGKIEQTEVVKPMPKKTAASGTKKQPSRP